MMKLMIIINLIRLKVYFKDYYTILNISPTATQGQIKRAFKKQALKWHPDRNQDLDTTIKMQEINEAYLILSDIEAKEKYDIEYSRFKAHSKRQYFVSQEFYKYSKAEDEDKTNFRESEYEFSRFDLKDEVLKKWMSNARKQSVEMAKQMIEDISTLNKEGLKSAGNEIGRQVFAYVIISVFFMIIFSLSKTCDV